MKNLIAAIALSVFAVLVVSTSEGSRPSAPVNPAAMAQARSAIEELPLPLTEKASYMTRIQGTPEANLPFLIEEARRAVVIDPLKTDAWQNALYQKRLSRLSLS